MSNWHATQTEVSEFVETVFREGDNQDRHLVLLTDTAADLIGAVLKPELKTREEPEAHIDIRCCHVKFLWPERPGARRYSGETGRNFPCIESFEAMVANCVCGSATRWNRETIAGR